MGAKLGDLESYFDPGLTLTVLGREYVVPLPSAELGLWCRLVAQAAGEVHAASTEQEMVAAVERIDGLPELPGGKDVSLPERVLGGVYPQMVKNKVPDPFIQFCGATAYVWILAGEEAAERYWYSGGRPEAWGPVNRQERRAATKKTRTAAGSVTKPRASTSGTKSPKKSSANAAAKTSRGRRS